MYQIPIITKLGGKAAVAKALRRTHKGRATEVSRKTINQWICRESIPGFAVIQMLAMASERGITVEPGDFERQGTAGRKSKKEVEA